MAGAISIQPERWRGSSKRKKKKTYLNGNRSQKIGLWLQEGGKKGYGAYCFHSRTFSLRRRGGGLCWFRQHKESLKPFEGTKSVHRETSSNGKLPVKHSHSATPMETTNQVQKGIKGYNVGGFWNPAVFAQSEAEWIRAGISDSSYLPAYCGFRLESYKVTLWLALPNKDITSLPFLKQARGYHQLSQWHCDFLRKGYPCRSRVWSAPNTCRYPAF